MKKNTLFLLLILNFFVTASDEQRKQTIFSPALSLILKMETSVKDIVAKMRSDKTYCVHHNKGKKLGIFKKLLDDESDAAKTNNFYLYQNISTTHALLYMAYTKLLLEKKKDELTDREKYLLSLPGAMSGYYLEYLEPLLIRLGTKKGDDYISARSIFCNAFQSMKKFKTKKGRKYCETDENNYQGGYGHCQDIYCKKPWFNTMKNVYGKNIRKDCEFDIIALCKKYDPYKTIEIVRLKTDDSIKSYEPKTYFCNVDCVETKTATSELYTMVNQKECFYKGIHHKRGINYYQNRLEKILNGTLTPSDTKPILSCDFEYDFYKNKLIFSCEDRQHETTIVDEIHKTVSNTFPQFYEELQEILKKCAEKVD